MCNIVVLSVSLILLLGMIFAPFARGCSRPQGGKNILEVPFTIFALALRRVKNASRSDTAVECLEDRQAFQQRENEPSRISGKKGTRRVHGV